MEISLWQIHSSPLWFLLLHVQPTWLATLAKGEFPFALSSQDKDLFTVSTDVPCHDLKPLDWVLLKGFK